METENKKMQKAAPFLVAAASVLWGTLVIFVKKLDKAGFSAMDIVCIRSYGSVFFLFPGLLVAQKKLKVPFLRVKLRDCWCFVGTGIFSIVFFSYCYFRNVEISSAAFSSILMYTSPVWVMLMSMVCFRERMTRRKLFALLLALVGCVLVSGIGSGITNVNVHGILLGLGSGIGYGLYTIFGQYALNKGYHPMTVAAYTFLFACVGVLPFTSLPELVRRLNVSPWYWALGLSMAFLVTALSFSLYTMGLRYMEPGRAAVLATLEPIVASLVGVVLYKEELSLMVVTGIVLVLVSSILVTVQPSHS